MRDIVFTIEQVTKENYHLFDDMVYWRMNGKERPQEEKEANKGKVFEEAFCELNCQGFYVYAALYNGRFVGWIACIYTPKIGNWKKGVIYIDELWTSPEFRREGIGKALVQKAFECQKETGAVKIRLYTGDDNVAAQELYKRCGFKIMGKAVFMETDMKTEYNKKTKFVGG